MKQKEIAVAEKIAAEAAKFGGRVYYVGGFVRDSLLGIDTKDVDIEVHGITPKKLVELLDLIGEHTEFGKSFGVYGLKGYELDIALPRREIQNGIGHRAFDVEVDPFIGVGEAAQRRDFTVNAVMKDVLSGELVDPTGGVRDLSERRLRVVCKNAFSEDPLRVLRAAQFAARFGLIPTDETLKSCRETSIVGLPRERVEGELFKALLKSEKPSVFFKFLKNCGKLNEYFPELSALIGVEQDPLRHPEGDAWEHTMKVVDAAAGYRSGASDAFGFMLAAAFHDLGKSVCTERGKDGRIHAYEHETNGLRLVSSQLARITGNRRLCRYVEDLVKLHMQPGTAAAMRVKTKTTNRMFDEALDPEALILLSKADHLGIGENTEEGYAESEAFLRSRLEHYRELMAEPFITSAELIDGGVIPGRGLSEALAFAHKLRLSELCRDSALKQVLALKNRWNGER